MGRNKYTSLKQRWLNSGYAIGPVADMRQLWKRAQEKVESIKEHPEWDNGSHGADFMYHGKLTQVTHRACLSHRWVEGLPERANGF